MPFLAQGARPAINWAHPLANGLMFLALPGLHTFDLVTGARTASKTGNFRAGIYGGVYNGTALNQLYTTPAHGNRRPLTLFGVARTAVQDASFRPIVCTSNAAASYWGLYLTGTSGLFTQKASMFQFDDAVDEVHSSVSPVVGKTYALIATTGGSQARMLLKDLQAGTNDYQTGTPQAESTPTTLSNFLVGNGTSDVAFNGDIMMAGVSASYLTREAMQMWAQDPLALVSGLKPVSKILNYLQALVYQNGPVLRMRG